MNNPVYEVRRKNLVRRLTERGAKTALAERMECTQGFITHLTTEPGKKGHRQISEDIARQAEVAMLLQPGELDRDPDAVDRRHTPPPENTVLLEEAVRVVIAASIEAHSKMAASKTASVVRLVYEQSLVQGHVDPAFVAQLVKLMR